MVTASIGASFDPATTAAALAETAVAGRRSQLTAQTGRATAIATALTTLKSAIGAFQSSLLAQGSKSMLVHSATFDNAALGTATATAKAAAGSYSFFVEQIATAHQVSYAGLPEGAPGGSLAVKLGGVPAFSVDLAAADSDTDGTLTVRELAAAINGADGNAGKVSATVATINGVPRLLLTAQSTGTSNAISLDPAAVANPALAAALAPANATNVVAAKDARVWLGAEATGTLMVQASNTFTNIDGVSMTFTKAQASGDPSVNLTVKTDETATVANVQQFVAEYNKLWRALDGLLASGTDHGLQAGAFANDAGVRMLKQRLADIARKQNAAGDTLAAFGIVSARDGSLTVDTTRLQRKLAADPTALDGVVGNAAGLAPSGIAADLDQYLKTWSSSVNGHIQQRRQQNDRLQADVTLRQQQLDRQYDAAYQRYLVQFTQLQDLQNRLGSNTSLFDSMFNSNN